MQIFESPHQFLDAFSHLYKRVCPSVRPSVGPSVTHELKPCKSAVFDQNNYQYERERILWSYISLLPLFAPFFAQSLSDMRIPYPSCIVR